MITREELEKVAALVGVRPHDMNCEEADLTSAAAPEMARALLEIHTVCDENNAGVGMDRIKKILGRTP
jgi:hypothetical protein